MLGRCPTAHRSAKRTGAVATLQKMAWNALRGLLVPASARAALQQGQGKSIALAGGADDVIRSLDNSLVKHCVKLRTSTRHRAEHKQFVLTSWELLEEAAGTYVPVTRRVGTLLGCLRFAPSHTGSSNAFSPLSFPGKHAAQAGVVVAWTYACCSRCKAVCRPRPLPPPPHPFPPGSMLIAA
jgi:hypothetical protein